jgi:hypothetical protein
MKKQFEMHTIFLIHFTKSSILLHYTRESIIVLVDVLRISDVNWILNVRGGQNNPTPNKKLVLRTFS